MIADRTFAGSDSPDDRGSGPTEGELRVMDAPTLDPGAAAPPPGPTGAAQPTDSARRYRAPRTPASVTAVAIVLLVLGGAIEGYAVALAAGTADTPGQSQSLIWALVGVVIILTAWGIRLGQWWAASTAVAVSLVGIALGGYGGLALATGLYGGQTRLTLIGLLAIGAASIAILGLIATAWPWFSMPRRSTRSIDSAS